MNNQQRRWINAWAAKEPASIEEMEGWRCDVCHRWLFNCVCDVTEAVSGWSEFAEDVRAGEVAGCIPLPISHEYQNEQGHWCGSPWRSTAARIAAGIRLPGRWVTNGNIKWYMKL